VSAMQQSRLILTLSAVLTAGAAVGCGTEGAPAGAGTGGSMTTGSGGAGPGSGGTSPGGSGGGGSTEPGGSGGAPAVGGADGGAGDTTPGSGGAAPTKNPMPNPNPTCTDAVLRTGPPAGKEALKAEPVDMKFPFSTHWMGRFSDNPSAVGITGMADFDNDGDLDFSSGQRGGPQFWWEYCSPDHWVQHRVGAGHGSPGGGNVVDADGDGWVDIIAGDSWYKNPQNPRTGTWQRLPTGVAGGAEDVAVGDVTGERLDAAGVDDQHPDPGRIDRRHRR